MHGFVDGPLLDARCAGRGGQRSLALRDGFFLRVLPPRLGGGGGLAIQILQAREDGRKEIPEFVVAVRAELRGCAELVGEEAGNVLKMVAECGGGRLHLALPESGGDLIPDFQVRFDQGAGVDRPAMESEGGLGGDKTG